MGFGVMLSIAAISVSRSLPTGWQVFLSKRLFYERGRECFVSTVPAWELGRIYSLNLSSSNLPPQ